MGRGNFDFVDSNDKPSCIIALVKGKNVFCCCLLLLDVLKRNVGERFADPNALQHSRSPESLPNCW